MLLFGHAHHFNFQMCLRQKTPKLSSFHCSLVQRVSPVMLREHSVCAVFLFSQFTGFSPSCAGDTWRIWLMSGRTAPRRCEPLPGSEQDPKPAPCPRETHEMKTPRLHLSPETRPELYLRITLAWHCPHLERETEAQRGRLASGRAKIQ